MNILLAKVGWAGSVVVVVVLSCVVVGAGADEVVVGGGTAGREERSVPEGREYVSVVIVLSVCEAIVVMCCEDRTDSK